MNVTQKFKRFVELSPIQIIPYFDPFEGITAPNELACLADSGF